MLCYALLEAGGNLMPYIHYTYVLSHSVIRIQISRDNSKGNISAVLNPSVLFDKDKDSALPDEFLTTNYHFGKCELKERTVVLILG